MSENPNLPQPDPTLKRLDRFVGRWSMEGHPVGSDETNIKGEASFPLAAGRLLPRAAHWDMTDKPRTEGDKDE